MHIGFSYMDKVKTGISGEFKPFSIFGIVKIMGIKFIQIDVRSKITNLIF